MSSQAPDTDPDFSVVSARLRRVDHEKLRRIAESDHRTVSGELRRIIEQYLEQADDPKAAA